MKKTISNMEKKELKEEIKKVLEGKSIYGSIENRKDNYVNELRNIS